MATAEKKKKNALIAYFENSYEEIRKVAWPTRNTAIRLTFLVLGFVIAVALVIGVLDYVFGIGQRALLDLAPDRALPIVETTTTPITDVTAGDDASGAAIDVGDITVSTGDEENGSGDVAPEETSEEVPAEETPAEEAPIEETPSE